MEFKKKCLLIFGTRPEAIKMAPVYFALKKNRLFDVQVCITGQHKELINPIISFFGIKVDYTLKVMRKNQSLSKLSASILTETSRVIKLVNPDYVFVHGDTATASFSSIAAFYNSAAIVHIEAGLRTYNLQSPFPEEFNRKVVAVSTSFHFAPTIASQNNLLKENIPLSKIFVSGNTVIDALLWTIKKLRTYRDYEIDFLKKIVRPKQKIILVTGHRRENFGKGFEQIFTALVDIAKQNPETVIIFPVHLNPIVKKSVSKYLNNIENIRLIKPLSYPSFVWLMKQSSLIITDSGGIQEEAPTLGIPILVTRNTSERPEAIKQKLAILVGDDSKLIIKHANKILSNSKPKKVKLNNPYGNGEAAFYITKVLENHIKSNATKVK